MKPSTKGHWPKGKRRNSDAGQWSRLRLRLTTLLDEHHQRGKISICACAVSIGVSDRSVRRWLRGEDVPTPESQEAIAAWMQEVMPKRRTQS